MTPLDLHRVNLRSRSRCITRSRAVLSAVTLAVIASTAVAAPPRASDRPNFVFILGEGHGWVSSSVPMDDAVPQSKSEVVRTPNLERLAAEGMRFANFYAPSPRCTPSRAAYFTGISPAQLHMTFVGEGRGDNGGADAARKIIPPRCTLELPEQAATIAEILKREGYATAHFGKWHVGRVSPARHGFDESDGATSNGGPDNVDNPHPKELYGMTERGMDFMARQLRAGKPFYLQISHYASRKGATASPEATAAVRIWGGNLNEREFAEAAADIDLDIALGRLLKRIDTLGIVRNTYVIFTTDHGSPGRNRPLSGGKGTIWEGGLRVPLIIRGPGIKAGVCSHTRAIGVDLFPTVAELARLREPLPTGIEGGSLAKVLQSDGRGAVQRSREAFVIHFPHYDKDELGPVSSILLGNFKLIRVYETGAMRLFDIVKDPAERHDLAVQMPEMARQLDRQLSNYLRAVDAQVPTVNLNYDPSNASTDIRKIKRGKRGGRGDDRGDPAESKSNRKGKKWEPVQ